MTGMLRSNFALFCFVGEVKVEVVVMNSMTGEMRRRKILTHWKGKLAREGDDEMQLLLLLY